MSKSKEFPIRVECMGGCGKHQTIRPSKIDRSWTFYGCGKCAGWDAALKSWRSRTPEGAHAEWSVTGVVGGFSGYRMRITTPEHEASFARAHALRDAGIAMLQGKR